MYAMLSAFNYEENNIYNKLCIEQSKKDKAKSLEDFKAEKLRRSGKKVFIIDGIEIIARTKKEAIQKLKK